LFVKIEKPFTIPRTQKFQIKKEVAGIRLCSNAGIPVPQIISADEDGSSFSTPWILLKFIEENLISNEHQLSAENKKLLGAEYENIFSKISDIASDFYGDTFSGGVIGQHRSWNYTMATITRLLFEDATWLNAFGNKAYIVEQAIAKALLQIESNLPPALFHCDLFSQNIMGVRRGGTVHIGHVIDFGMSIFAPRAYSHYLTWKYTDFAVTPIDIAKKYEIDQNELTAYDILRMEPVLLANIFKFYGYDVFTQEFVQMCEHYLV